MLIYWVNLACDKRIQMTPILNLISNVQNYISLKNDRAVLRSTHTNCRQMRGSVRAAKHSCEQYKMPYVLFDTSKAGIDPGGAHPQTKSVQQLNNYARATVQPRTPNLHQNFSALPKIFRLDPCLLER